MNFWRHLMLEKQKRPERYASNIIGAIIHSLRQQCMAYARSNGLMTFLQTYIQKEF